MPKSFRTAFLISHPIQYQSPLFRELSKNSAIELTVLYCSDQGLRPAIDPGFGVSFKWDTPLLEGYKYDFLKNYSPKQSLNSFFGCINLGVVRRILSRQYDAVIMHGYGSVTHLLAITSCLISRTPMYFRGETVIKSGLPTWKQLLFRIFYRLFRGIFYIGSKSKEFYTAIGIDEKKLHFTPYAVDNDFFTHRASRLRPYKKDLKKKYGLPNLPVILFAAKLIPRKRPLDLLNAFDHIKKSTGALVFVGDGILRSELETEISSRSIENVFFTGFKNQTEICELYACGDMFVLPSAYESFGLVVNEAMCFSLPVIATEGVAATEDLICHGENGLVYPIGDVEALSRYLAKLLADESLRSNMGKLSAERIHEWNYAVCTTAVERAVNVKN